MFESVTLFPPVTSICKVEDPPNGGGKLPFPVIVAVPVTLKPLARGVKVPLFTVMW